MRGAADNIGHPDASRQAAAMRALLDLERARGRPCLAYCSGESPGKLLQPADVNAVYQALRRRGRLPQLDLLIVTQGGAVPAAHRLACLLRDYAAELVAMVPARAHSAATVLCLAADEILIGPAGELSPIDPALSAAEKGLSGLSAPLEAEDVRAFRTLVEKECRLARPSDRLAALRLLAETIPPHVQGALYRAEHYVIHVVQDLFRLRRKPVPPRKAAALARTLISGYPEHRHGLTLRELRALGVAAIAPAGRVEAAMAACHEACLHWMRERNEQLASAGCAAGAVLLADGAAWEYLAPWGAPPAGAPARRPRQGEWVLCAPEASALSEP